MLEHLLHLFTPRSSNNHHPRLLQPAGLALLASLYLFFNASVRLFAIYDEHIVHGDVLGFASNIYPEEIIELTNEERAKAGLPTLKENSLLSQAAQAKASDMFTFNYWAHTNTQNGKEPWAFIREAGYSYKYAGENLARDFGDTPSMMAAWIASPSHRVNILSDRYDEIGIAVVNGTLEGVETTLVVQMFGRGTGSQAVAATTTLGKAKELVPQVSAQEKPPEPEEPVVETITVNPPESEAIASPVISPLSLNKAVAMSILLLLSIALIVDYVMLKRAKVLRVSGKGLAHLSFIGVLIIIVLMSGPGGIL
ncbi:MAG: hypothetical protein HYS86_01050 [Candidatus Chisholmbacteria bacterium]|nr:hypothetical protein [Candidatus Chisholmbacteria bacterium]